MRIDIARTFSCLVVLATASTASADDGNEILKKVEDTLNAPKDRVAVMKMTLKDSDGSTKTRELSLKQKGSDLRMLKFQSPAEVKGVGFLTRSADEMYLYMPEFGKVRRIASHVKNESFMGTDFSYEDLGQIEYSDDYTGKVVKQDGTTAVIELTPKNAEDTEYSRMLMTVDTTKYFPTATELFDKKGQRWKVLKQEEIENVSGYWIAKRVTMTDLLKKHTTVMELSDIRFDTGLGDADFSRRKLKRAR